MGGEFHARNEIVEMVLEQMLEDAGRYCHAQILIRRRTPTAGERPDWLRIGLDEFAHLNDRLPPWIDFPLPPVDWEAAIPPRRLPRELSSHPSA
jgi:hypothetical protein